MITVTFTADTLFQGSIRANGSTLSVTEADARVLVDIGVATASGLSPQGGWPQGEFGTMSLVDDAPSNGSEYVRKNAAWTVSSAGSPPVTSVAGKTGAVTLTNSDISGLGTMATATASDYLAKAENLSGLANTGTARTNLGLGTIATINDAPSDGSEYVRKNAAWSVATGGGGGGSVNVQIFGGPSSSGTFTNGWTKPAGAKFVRVYLYGAGGGGGSGARQATTSNRCGGAGGAGGGFVLMDVGADVLGSTESVVVGTGGTGGASVTNDSTNGANGVSGGISTFGPFRSMNGGSGSGGGTATSIAGPSGPWSRIYTLGQSYGAAGAGQTTTGSNGNTWNEQFFTPTGGGGGAGATANVTTNRSGGNGGALASVSGFPALINTVAGGSGGTTAGVQATTGTQGDLFKAGTGGGGGFYRTGEVGGTGANGAWPSGGGGGGGASDNGYASGAGGEGANGLVIVMTYCT